MLASSWRASGLVQAAWQRLDVKKERREKLAELTGIPATNLSGMNTGRIPMTLEMAERIAAAVPGLSVLDLGAPERVLSGDAERSGLDRLRQLEDEHRELRRLFDAFVIGATERLSSLEAGRAKEAQQ